MPFLIKAGIILGNVGVAPVPSAPPRLEWPVWSAECVLCLFLSTTCTVDWRTDRTVWFWPGLPIIHAGQTVGR